jgi:hypothetical protein
MQRLAHGYCCYRHWTGFFRLQLSRSSISRADPSNRLLQYVFNISCYVTLNGISVRLQNLLMTTYTPPPLSSISVSANFIYLEGQISFIEHHQGPDPVFLSEEWSGSQSQTMKKQLRLNLCL